MQFWEVQWRSVGILNDNIMSYGLACAIANASCSVGQSISSSLKTGKATEQMMFTLPVSSNSSLPNLDQHEPS